MRGGYKSQRICCEAYTRKSIREKAPRKCRAKGYFTPSVMGYRCMFHGGLFSYDFHTRKYKGLFKNKKIDIVNKIKRLKNLKNFKDKSDDEIKRYIRQEEERSNANGYRTKYFTKQLNRWKSRYRRGKSVKDQIENFIRLSGKKS